MGKAYAKCATLQIASKGFSKCGILLFDRNKFLESDFIDVEEHQPEPLLDLGQPQEAESPVDFQGPIASTSNAPNAFPEPVTATTKTLEEDMQKKKIVSPFVLKPPPKLPEVTSKPKRGRPAGKSAIITSSPYKNNLEKEIQQAKNKEQQLQEKKKAKSKGEKRMKGKQTEEYKPIKKKRTIPSCEQQLPFKKATKRKIFDVGTQDETSDEDSDIPLVSTDDEDSADEECVYCCQPYKEDKCGEQWIRCIKCLRWAHELCSGADKKGWKTFTCDFCQKHL